MTEARLLMRERLSQPAIRSVVPRPSTDSVTPAAH
jgi:hypothetical protein